MSNLRNLPIGLDEFSMLRAEDILYVDKTSQIQKLIESGKRYFLARPKGFGKSLTISTLAAMFSGKSQFFKGLAAEAWVRECAKRPYPVLRFDFSTLSTKNAEYFEQSLQKRISSLAKQFSIALATTKLEESLIDLFDEVYNSLGYTVILIDDYDAPIVNTLDKHETLFSIYKILKSFYEILDRYNKYSRFLMITGQEKFTQNGIFSTVYNIQDISSNEDFSDLVGFTESEFISNFSEWIEISANNLNVKKDYLLQKLTHEIQDYYNHKSPNLYHPFSLLTCLQAKKLDEYINFLEINRSNSSHIYTCINQGDSEFSEIRNSKIYVDKSELLIYTNQLLETDNKYICISRPRRFGKTFTAKMISAYYDQSGQAQIAFKGLKITKNSSFQKYANKYIVIKLTIQTYLSAFKDIDKLLQKIQTDIIYDLLKQYYIMHESHNLNKLMRSITQKTGKKFIIVIDEWDCLLREYKEQATWQEKYLDFLRSWFKDQEYIALVYMTGILPIKKYGTHSALNMFDEYTMLAADPLTEFVGFTEAEVKELCRLYQRDFINCKRWYDEYKINNFMHIYNPRSVNRYINSGIFKTYWNNTETYKALQVYITMKNYGLHECITKLLAHASIPVETKTFANDMKTFHSKDDILTLLVHLGYLSYDCQSGTVSIPNTELAEEFVTAIRDGGWPIVLAAIQNSSKLLHAVLNLEAETVARGIEAAHQEMSHLQYNDENALAYTISLAFYAAREHYTIVREFPTGKGFADLVFLPRPNCTLPILLVELKWDKTCQAAIAQIHRRHYPDSLADRSDKILLVGINYHKESKNHQCCIQWFQL